MNTALRQADAHARSLQDLPEWQRLQTLRGAFGNVWRVLKDRAGEHLDRLMGDSRVADFIRKVSVRACEKVAGLAQAGADRLRRDDGRAPGKKRDLPSAEALLRLGNAAFSYSAPPSPRGRHRTRWTSRTCGRWGKPWPARCREPGPGFLPRLPAAGRPRPSGPWKGPPRTAGHLRRGGSPEQKQSRKPQR